MAFEWSDSCCCIEMKQADGGAEREDNYHQNAIIQNDLIMTSKYYSFDI